MNKIKSKKLGDWQDYGMRMYSPWQRRFPSPDPLIVYGQEYPWYSPYQFAGNKPIWAVDLDGLEAYVKLAVEDKGGKVNTMRVIPWSEIYPAETHGPWGKGTVDYTLRDQPRNNNTRHMNVRVQFQTNVNGVKINIDDNICVETRKKTVFERINEVNLGGRNDPANTGEIKQKDVVVGMGVVGVVTGAGAMIQAGSLTLIGALSLVNSIDDALGGFTGGNGSLSQDLTPKDFKQIPNTAKTLIGIFSVYKNVRNIQKYKDYHDVYKSAGTLNDAVGVGSNTKTIIDEAEK